MKSNLINKNAHFVYDNHFKFISFIFITHRKRTKKKSSANCTIEMEIIDINSGWKHTEPMHAHGQMHTHKLHFLIYHFEIKFRHDLFHFSVMSLLASSFCCIFTVQKANSIYCVRPIKFIMMILALFPPSICSPFARKYFHMPDGR